MTASNDRFRRIELMLGQEACERLRKSFVMVVGLGAVGSYAVEGLARAGIGRLRLIDSDKVAHSNINRQLYALESTVGQLKCEVARERVLDINPECRVEALNAFIDGKTASEFLEGPPDLVIDAIDALNPKVDLIEAVRNLGIPHITCLGAAMRLDPMQVRIAPLSETHTCPLASMVRQRLRRRGVSLDFPCVYSEEQLPRPLPLVPPDDPMGEQPLVQRGRTRNTMGSMPTITGIFGLTAANLAIRMLVGRE